MVAYLVSEKHLLCLIAFQDEYVLLSAALTWLISGVKAKSRAWQEEREARKLGVPALIPVTD